MWLNFVKQILLVRLIETSVRINLPIGAKTWYLKVLIETCLDGTLNKVRIEKCLNQLLSENKVS